MYFRNYTKELGIKSGDVIVPKVLGVALIAVAAVGAWYWVGQLPPAAPKPVEVAPTPAPTPVKAGAKGPVAATKVPGAHDVGANQ